MFEAAPTSGVYDLFSRIFTDTWQQQPSHAESDSDGYTDDDGNERSEDAYNFLRAFGPDCSDVAEVVARHDREKQAMKIKTVSDWRDGVLQCDLWFLEADSESHGASDRSVEEGSDEEQETEWAGC